MVVKFGTILPTAASLAANDAYARNVKARQTAVANAKLTGCDPRMVGGEMRYYATPTRYAIVNRSGRILWFTVTPKGDYPSA